MIALNPLGVELFHFKSDKTGTRMTTDISVIERRRGVLLMVAQDIRHMYFDLLPSSEADTDVESTYVEFDHDNNAWQYGGDPAVLIEKRHDWLLGTVWRVRYYEYTAAPRYPRGIVMNNFEFHYRIIIKNLKWKAQ